MNEEYTKKSWVGGICIHDNKVLLIHRINKESNFTKEYFIFPGKDVLEDETPEKALEKSFLDISITVALGDLLYSKDDDSGEEEAYYTCTYILGEPALIPTSDQAKEMEEGEQVYAPLWVELSDLEDLIIYPESVKIEILENLVK